MAEQQQAVRTTCPYCGVGCQVTLHVDRPANRVVKVTGAEGVLTPAGEALPLDVFITVSDDPAAIMREYARQRGLRRLMIPVPLLTPRLLARAAA